MLVMFSPLVQGRCGLSLPGSHDSLIGNTMDAKECLEANLALLALSTNVVRIAHLSVTHFSEKCIVSWVRNL